MATTKKKPAAKKVRPPIRSSKKAPSFLESRLFSWPYMAFSLLALLGTTFYWALLGAKLQLGNADQVVDTLLFKNRAILHGSTFPGAHSFLIKWPIYWLINVFGSTDKVIDAFTIGLVLITVALLVGIIYLIERRPIVFGTICLGLASVLLLIPITPYAGAILPVNMAMLSTRNIEYIVFIFSLILLVRSPKIKSWGFWLSALALSLLIASDKLFLIFAVGGAIIVLIAYAKTKTWAIASLAVNWLIVGVIATVGAYIILAIVSRSGLAHISSQSSVSPYNLTSSLKNLALGGIYGVMAILTNFGANPAYAANKVKAIPHQLLTHLLSTSGPAYVINLIILAIGLLAVYQVIRASLVMKLNSKKQLSRPAALSIILIWTSLVAVVSFVATSHYYAVDARYLTIILFTVFITLAVYTSTKKCRPEYFVIAGLIISLGMVAGVVGATQSYNSDKNALAPQNNRNSLIAQVLYEHNVAVLVGDYWRVVPIKQVADNLAIQPTSAKVAKSVTNRLSKSLKALTILPLSNCTEALQTLSSTAWQPNLNNTKFAYLLSLDDSLTNYPNCSLSQVTSVYGKPDASALIDGTLSHPVELLLFYDQGVKRSAPATEAASDSSTVLPIPLSQLPDTSCAVPSIMNIVAHEDDDLLFMNPDLMHEVDAGDCISTIYITAGNAGAGEYYWLSREEGSEAAYAYMLGTSNDWVQKIVELAPNEYITIANPKSSPKVSLIFMHLPDGNLQGQGFSSSDFESLVKLENGQIKVINSVDNQSYYTSAQLINALSMLMNIYQPSGINTQSDVVGTQYPDHSDHLTVNWFVRQAYKQFETQKYANQVTIPIKYYIGYPIHEMAANVSGEALEAKEAVFLTYAKYDSHACQTLQTCLQNPAYNAYLTRQYQSSD